MPGGWKRFVKRKRHSGRRRLDLEGKVADASHQGSLGLEGWSDDDDTQSKPGDESGVYGGRRSAASLGSIEQARRFNVTPTGEESSVRSQQESNPSSSRNQYRNVRVRRSRNTTSSLERLPRVAVHVVCAIGENLARETCVASLDAGTPVALQVTKQGNGQTYSETLAYLEILKPDEILLNEGRRHSQLARKVLQLHDEPRHSGNLRRHVDEDGESTSVASTTEVSTVVKFISRSYFDQTKGAELLQRVARQETYDASVVEEYILLSSAHAVLHYTQKSLGASFSRNCLNLTINSGGNNRMSIDRSTLFQLELLSNSKSGKTRNSLIASINCTKTTVGSRLLRTNIMAPPCGIHTINSRLDLVESFLTDEDFFYTVLENLRSLPDVDKMLSNVALIPRKKWKNRGKAGDVQVVTEQMASKGISALVCIKTTLQALPAFAMVLSEQFCRMRAKDSRGGLSTDSDEKDDTTSTVAEKSSLLIGLGGGASPGGTPQRHLLLDAIVAAMKQPALNEILEAVKSVFMESTSFSRNANAMRHQECFALKSEDNGMLDILRRAFLANVDDIYKKADEYAEIHGMHVSVRHSSSRGYYLSVPIELASTLPPIFIQPAKSGQYINCTTEEVQSLNIRAKDNVQDLLLMTYEKIEEILDFARSKYDALASLCDAVALLDLCHSFADNVTLSKLPWTRPKVTIAHDDESGEAIEARRFGGLSIRNGRFGIEVTNSCLASDGILTQTIPNDTYVTDAKNFTVISGINGAGKSMYLKQIAIIVILAHCGSYVPADKALIPIRTRLCARIGTSDDQENNMSSFMLEMKETAFICNHANSKSLILLDELGRSTSDDDGVAIAWSVSELLISKQSMVFFVTHYPQLCHLSTVYPNVQNYHMKALISDDSNGEIRYTYKVRPGSCSVASAYGVEMASFCGWPIDVLENARRIEADVKGRLQQGGFCELQPQDEADRSMLSSLEGLRDLLLLLNDAMQSAPSILSLRSTLQVLRQRVSPTSAPVYATMIELLQDDSGTFQYNSPSRLATCVSTLVSHDPCEEEMAPTLGERAYVQSEEGTLEESDRSLNVSEASDC